MSATAQSEISRGSLWFGLLGGGVAWTAHLLLAYAVAEFGCVASLAGRSFLNLTLVAWLEVALTVVTALIAGAATAVAYRSHRRLQAGGDWSDAVASERHVAWIGLLTSGLFTLAILFESIPILYYLDRC